MKRRLIKVIKGESGQALPIVLTLLVLGGLLIAPSLSYAATSLNSGRVIEKNVNGLYAADAGVEYALWRLENAPPSSYPDIYLLPENVNQMQVDIQTEEIGTYTLYMGELVEVGEPPQIHYDYVTVDGETVWVEEAQAYKYTITVTWQPQEGYPTISLEGIGVRLPVGYSYQAGSAHSFGGNLSTSEPVDTLDGAGAHLLHWEFGSPRPQVSQDNPTRTQALYITGEGELNGDYTWVEGQPNAIGQVGEVIGAFYRITATATHPEDGEITAEVVADVMWYEQQGEMRILLWEINPQ